MKSSFITAAEYAEKELGEEEAGVLDFTYIKTDTMASKVLKKIPVLP